MFTNGFSQGNKRWTLKQESKAQMDNLKEMGVDDEKYKPTLDSIEKISRIRNEKIETAVKVIKDIGMLVVCAGLGVAAYKLDESDSIMRNKACGGLFNKLFRG